MKKLIYPLLLISTLLTGCQRTCRQEACPVFRPIHREIVNTRELTFIPIIVNSAYYPEESLKGAVEVFKKYTDANVTISKVFDINIPEDHNGAISLKQVASIQFSIVSTKFIPVLFVPSINDFDNRGFCQTFAKPDNQLINQRIVINGCRVESRAKHLLTSQNFVYRLVILHEMCHALGVPADPNHSDGMHCTNPNCILYEGIDVKSVSYAIFHFGPPKGLCKDCLYEIALARRNSSVF